MGGADARGGEGGGGEVAWQPVSVRLLWELAILGRGRPGAGSARAAPRSLRAPPRGGSGGWAPRGSGRPGSLEPNACRDLAPPNTLPWTAGRSCPLGGGVGGVGGSVTKPPEQVPRPGSASTPRTRGGLEGRGRRAGLEGRGAAPPGARRAG